MNADENAWAGLLDTVVTTLTEGVTVVDGPGTLVEIALPAEVILR